MRLTIARGDTRGDAQRRRNDERVRREELELLFQPTHLPFSLFLFLSLCLSLTFSLLLSATLSGTLTR